MAHCFSLHRDYQLFDAPLIKGKVSACSWARLLFQPGVEQENKGGGPVSPRLQTIYFAPVQDAFPKQRAAYILGACSMRKYSRKQGEYTQRFTNSNGRRTLGTRDAKLRAGRGRGLAQAEKIVTHGRVHSRRWGGAGFIPKGGLGNPGLCPDSSPSPQAPPSSRARALPDPQAAAASLSTAFLPALLPAGQRVR